MCVAVQVTYPASTYKTMLLINAASRMPAQQDATEE